MERGLIHLCLTKDNVFIFLVIAEGLTNTGLHYQSVPMMSYGCDDGLYLEPLFIFYPKEMECASSSSYPSYSAL